MIAIEGLPQTGAMVRWLSLTPWIGSRFQTHISIPGGEGLGEVFDRGCDNRVATLTGIVSWQNGGEDFLQQLGGILVTVKRSADDESGVLARAATPSVTEYQGAVIRFTLTLTEVLA